MNPTQEAKIKMPDWPKRVDVDESPDPRIYTDELTGLKNRAWLSENLPEIIKRDPGEIALLMLDLDGFKAINDTEGHAAGDEYLKRVANVLADNTREDREDREEDAIRLSGDEFIVILHDIHNEENLQLVKERLEKALEEKDIKASVGSIMHQGEEASDFLEKADAAMYEVKNARKEVEFKEMPRRKKAAAHLGEKMLRYAGKNPPRQ